MAIAILNQSIADIDTVTTTRTISGFNVPAGTDMLLILPILRAAAGSTAGAITSITHNGGAASAGFNNYSGTSTGRINSMVAYRRNPDVGTFDIALTYAGISGGPVWLLALSGVIGTGSPVGQVAAQKNAASSTTVGLGLTPSFAGSLLLAVLGSGNNAGTITGFTGTNFTETATDRYSPNGDFPATARYRPNAPAAATSVSATISLAGLNNGGVFAEILAEASATTDVSGTADATVTVAGSISSGLAQAEILDAGFRQLSAWTEILSLQGDVAGVDRRIISAGVLGTPTLTLDLLATNKNCSWGYRLSDGNVRIDSGANTQSLSPQHLALIHNGAAGQAILLNGVVTGGIVEGAGLSGSLVLPTGGERIGSHGAISPAPYTGLIGRYLLYGQAMSVEQVRLLALSETDPDALWGVGSEDDAQVSNQSLVACPLHSELDGQATIEIIPTILDPSGGTLTITGVTQPANGTLAISGLRLIYNPTRGWQGTNSATYTASDGIKSSTGKLTFRQTRPALKCTDDTITVASLGSVIFDPRTNDVGAGSLTIVTNSTPSRGAVTVEADGRLKYTNQTTGTTDSFTYTVRDAYSEQSATVSVMITTTSFLAAGDVSTSTTKDKFVDVDVVAAASASADLMPIVVRSGSITTPTLGTATLQADGKIRYTPETGESGYTDQFDFVLKPSAAATPTDIGTVSVAVTAVGGLPHRQPAVDVSRWHCVGFDPVGRKATYAAGRAGLVVAVAAGNLVAGDVIVLADGTYSGGDIRCERSGTASTDGHNHIMVRARTHGRAIVALKVHVPGSYWWFTGIKFTYNGNTNPNYSTDGQALHSAGAGFWVTNCMFTGYAFIHLYPNNAATNLRICYNTVAATTLATGSDTGVFITMHEYGNSDRAPPDTEIAWNKVTLGIRADAPGEGNSRNIIILHPSHTSVVDQAGFCTQSFRFHHNHCVGPWSEAFYIKRNICIEYNYIEWTNGLSQSSIVYRHGMITNNPKYDVGGIIRGNRCKNTAKATEIYVGGVGNSITCNVLEGGQGGEISLAMGNKVIQPPPPRDGADNAQIVENIGWTTIVMGEPSGGGSVVGDENAAGRNGWPSNVRIYKGASGWNPNIRYGQDSSTPKKTCPTGNRTIMPDNYGTGNAARVTPITVGDLTGATPPVGCDSMP